jgi:hypothetical protein
LLLSKKERNLERNGPRSHLSSDGKLPGEMRSLHGTRDAQTPKQLTFVGYFTDHMSETSRM